MIKISQSSTTDVLNTNWFSVGICLVEESNTQRKHCLKQLEKLERKIIKKKLVPSCKEISPDQNL